MSPLTLTVVPGPASLVSGVSVEPASLPALGLCETERQATAHAGTETQWCLLFGGEQNLRCT